MFADQGRGYVAKQTISFVAAGVDAGNTRLIYRTMEFFLVYRPEGQINPLSGFVAGEQYFIIPKTNWECLAVSPPLPAGELGDYEVLQGNILTAL